MSVPEKAQKTREERDAQEVRARLKALRKGLGKTQPEFAELCGISAAQYPKYETRGLIRTEALIKVCRATGVSADSLLGLEKKRGRPPRPRLVRS